VEIFGIGPPTLILHFLGDIAVGITTTVVPLFVVPGRTVIAALLPPLLIPGVIVEEGGG
jgi:hypothetical protein